MHAMTYEIDLELDLSGLTCPLPLLKAKQALNRLEPGQIVMVTATDPGSERDFQVFAQQSSTDLLEFRKEAGRFHYWLRKG